MGAEQSTLLEDQQTKKNYISFFVNGKEYNVRTEGFDVDPEYGPNYMLLDFVRDKIGLTGTKWMCREGGCGVCAVHLYVHVKSLHPTSGEQIVRSACSCLLNLYACDGLDITTVEGLGNAKTGYNQIQDRLVKFGGTQCGFCSPSQCMTFFSYSQVNPRFTVGNVEYSLDTVLCRCTGYRPIMDAFKSLSTNASGQLKQKCMDIEVTGDVCYSVYLLDCYKCPLPSLDGDNSELKHLSLEIITSPRDLFIQNSISGNQWVKVSSLATLFDFLQKLKYVQKTYRLVAGNTGIGMFSNDGPYSTYININDIPELHSFSMDSSSMVLGGGTSLTTAIDRFTAAAKIEGFVYASEFSKHFRRTASLTVRNFATLAGNLMIKRDHPEFVSDVFVLFDSIGATVQIGSSPTVYQTYSMGELLHLDMTGKVIISIHLPTFESNHVFRSFKVSQRYQNCQAHVNAAFLMRVDKTDRFKILGKPSLCFGGTHPHFLRATTTEVYFEGKYLDAGTIKGALETLEREVDPDVNPTSASPAYRRGLAAAYLYKFILGIIREGVQPKIQAGADDVVRGLNSGTQVFDTDKSKLPLYQPIPKLESYPQVSGEAEFIDDIPARRNELFGVFILTTVAKATIAKVDASLALRVPGIVAFITAKDVPGKNNYAVFGAQEDEIFVSKKVQYAGQPVGLLVGKNRNVTMEARDKVKISYENVQKPVIDIKESVKLLEELNSRIETDFSFPCRGITAEKAKIILKNLSSPASSALLSGKSKSEKGSEQGNLLTVKGEFITRGQYHFHMENQICLCIPKEDGMDVFSATQHMDNVQAAIASCLNVPNNSINMVVHRVGGSFGAKANKANLVSTACAVAAHVTNQPVRVPLDLETNMRMIGKRLPYLTKYEATVEETGKIQKLTCNVYCDTGSNTNDNSSLFATICFQSCYKANEEWDLTPFVARTDTAPNTFCRSPGSAQGIAAVENLMEHIAAVVKKDPFQVRSANFIEKNDILIGIPGAKLTTSNPLPGMIEELKRTSDFESRKTFIDSYNKANRWRKRGLAIVPQRMPIYYSDFRLPTLISVYHVDGTISVSHGGIEMGQGINTKVAQVVAYTLAVPLDAVKIKQTNNLISPNAAFSAASVTSELICHSAKQACLKLLENIQPVREAMGNPTWQQLVTACNNKGILLTSQHQDVQGDVISYDAWGAAITEVDVDVLTGDYRIIRVDIIEDAGDSMNPLIDIGQIEGAFVMGLGWLLTESLVYDKETGELLTYNTWNYKPMLAADIPENLNVTLQRNAPNPFGVMSSKTTAEPPLNMSISVMFALRNAIDSARRDAGNFDWYPMDAPVSKEDIRRLALTSTDQFVL